MIEICSTSSVGHCFAIDDDLHLFFNFSLSLIDDLLLPQLLLLLLDDGGIVETSSQQSFRLIWGRLRESCDSRYNTIHEEGTLCVLEIIIYLELTINEGGGAGS